MSKKTNYKNKKEISTLLAEYKMTIEEAKEWLGIEAEKKGEIEPDNSQTTNVSFYPAQNTENTKVYVEDKFSNLRTELNGVVRASLSYDPDLGFPVLTLEIANPKVISGK